MSFLKNSVWALMWAGAGFMACVAAPANAQQPNGYPITNVNLRAGPGTDYPVILTVPADAPITILGCLPDYTWCDSVFRNYRGWMRSIYLSGYSEGDYYLLRDYAPDLGYRRVTFNIDAYWDSYYRDEPFYGDRGRWGRPREAGWVDDNVFYNRLSPYGSWTWIQGQYVWVPRGVDRGWRPYTRGRWVYTDRGWTWVSREPFGWATYHYGRWGFSNRVGWFWVPGNRWAPAWVSWRQSDDYLAWAPLPPSYDRGYERGYDRNGGGININISFGDVPDYYWSMVPSRDFLSDDLPRYYVNDRDRRRRDFERTRPVGHTTIVNKTVVNNVVNVTYVEQKTKKKVVRRRIAATDNAEAAGKVEGDTLEVYEPKPDETSGAEAPPEPKNVEAVAEESETKGQAEGEATTEDQLAPKEVQEAIKARKGKGRKAEPGTEAEAIGEAALPEGELADAPPPAADTGKEAPVPAHDVTAPKTEEPTPEAEKKPDAAPKADEPVPDAKKPDAAPQADEPVPDVKEPDAAPKTEEPAPEVKKPAPDVAPETDEPKTPEPDAAQPAPDAEQKPGAPKGENADKPKKEKPSEKKPAPADKAPSPAKKQDEAVPAPEPETPPEAKTETPAEPEAKKPEVKEPEATQPEPKQAPPESKPEAEDTPAAKPQKAIEKPEPKKPEPKKPEPKKPEPKKPEAKKPEPKKPEPKKPEPKKPEQKKPEPKKPEPKKPEPKKPEPKKPEQKKPEPKKPEPKKPEPKKPEPKKPEAKKPEPKKPEPKKPEPKKPEPKKPEAKKPEAKKQESKKPTPKKTEAEKPKPEAKAQKPGGPSQAAARPDDNKKKKKQKDKNAAE
jgi:uncharacterized protein YraI